MEESEALNAVRNRDVSRIRELGYALYDSDELYHDFESQTEITPLHLAARMECSDVVKALLDVGARRDVPCTSGKVPIEEIQFDTKEAEAVCLLLLKTGLTDHVFEYRSATLYTLLLRATLKLRPLSVQYLILSGAPVHETSRFIGCRRSYITTPLLSWAGMDVPKDKETIDRHADVGEALLGSYEPWAQAFGEALRRAITVGNRAAAEAIVRRGVDLVKNMKSMYHRDVLSSAINGHYPVQRRDEFIFFSLNSGYRVPENLQSNWIEIALPSLLVCRGMTCRTARLLFSLIGRLCRKPDVWEEAIHEAQTEGEEVNLQPEILNGLLQLQTLNPLSLMNLCRDTMRAHLAINTPDVIRASCVGSPPSIRRFLFLEDIFPDS